MAVFKDWTELEELEGENLIHNGNFPDNVDGWQVPANASIDWSDGHAVFSQTQDYRSARQNIAVTPGVTYQLSADITDGDIEGRCFMANVGGGQSNVLREGSEPVTFTPNASEVIVYFGGLAGTGSCTFDNISLRPA